MNEKVCNLTTLSSALNLKAVENQVKEHNNQVNSKLVVLQTAIDYKIDILDSKQNELDMKISVNSELERNILNNIAKQLNKTSRKHLDLDVEVQEVGDVWPTWT